MPETTAPPAAAWIEKIQRNLPDDPRSRNILVRVLLLLLQIRHAPEFWQLPTKVFAQLNVNWPRHASHFSLGPAAAAFSDIDEVTVEAIRGYLLTRLAELAPKNSLRAHLRRTFDLLCTDTDHLAHVADNPGAMIPMFMIVLKTGADVAEDFTMWCSLPLDDDDISTAIRMFYGPLGCDVYDCESDGLIVVKDDEVLFIKFSNHSQTPDARRGLVTVKSVSLA